MRLEHHPEHTAQFHDRAWRVLFGACLGNFCSMSGLAMFSFGVFAPEIASATHWPPVVLATAIGAGAITGAIMSPFVGLVTDRIGVRRLAMIGGPTLALGFALLGLLPTSVGAYIALTILVWILSFAALPVPYAQLLTGWFSKRRGLALSIMFSSGSLGVAVWPSYGAYLILQFGWRMAYVLLGLSAGTIILGAALFFMLDPPPPSLSPTSVVADKPLAGLSTKEAAYTLTFWKIASVFMIFTGAIAGMAVGFPVILRHRGFDAQTAASIASCVGTGMFIGRLSLGFFLDRWFSPYITIGIALFPIAAFSLLLLHESTISYFVAASLLGFGLGTEYNAGAYIVSRAFGLRAFGSIYGIICLFYTAGSAIGTTIVGALLAGGAGIQAISAFGLILMLIAIGLLLTFKHRHLPFAVSGA